MKEQNTENTPDSIWPPTQLQAVVGNWRKPGDVSVCNFCHLHQTPHCPFMGKEAPAQGYCPQFALGALSHQEVHAKIVADMDAHPPTFEAPQVITHAAA